MWLHSDTVWDDDDDDSASDNDGQNGIGGGEVAVAHGYEDKEERLDGETSRIKIPDYCC